MKIVQIAFAISLAGVAPIAAAQVAPGDAAASKGNAVCLDADHIDHTAVVDERTILYYMRGNKVWKNTLRAPCPSLKFEQAFSEEIRGGEICSNAQMIRVHETGAWCSLGAFTPYTPPAKSAAKWNAGHVIRRQFGPDRL